MRTRRTGLLYERGFRPPGAARRAPRGSGDPPRRGRDAGADRLPAGRGRGTRGDACRALEARRALRARRLPQRAAGRGCSACRRRRRRSLRRGARPGARTGRRGMGGAASQIRRVRRLACGSWEAAHALLPLPVGGRRRRGRRRPSRRRRPRGRERFASPLGSPGARDPTAHRGGQGDGGRAAARRSWPAPGVVRRRRHDRPRRVPRPRRPGCGRSCRSRVGRGARGASRQVPISPSTARRLSPKSSRGYDARRRIRACPDPGTLRRSRSSSGGRARSRTRSSH